ncbi:polymer-forming cytoskeletal protein [Acetobacter sp. AN02]|uniref:bactofilin family protein n=1 Tax=Acetobacter sp. AN02 TaxID=2894186 RepID=UPI0024340F61|nr:polymer-forming cytoskeletal protein [Acetobacter sp. AN02]MDG6095475.1 polymer-forming cytoskeletal protein [Acetobacter sp. AN02]
MLFKRQKPEESKPATPTPAAPPAKASTASGGRDALFPNDQKAAAPAQKSPEKPAAASSPSTPSQSKDSTQMNRPPFPPAPTPAAGGGSSVPPGVVPSGAPRAGGADPARKEDDRRTLVVGRGISVQGTVQDAERLVVEGTVESSMIIAKELSVALGGLFRGGVEVEDAEIAGTVDGTLTVRGSLTVSQTGRLLGKATCKRLKVEDGGQITGQLEMLTEAQKPVVEKTAS